MKRVKAACICQTLQFLPKDENPDEQTRALVREDVAQYKKTLDRNRTRYRIVEETEQSDGSITVKVIKQHNSSPVGDYLN